jgi:hypothetical protein
MVPNVSEELIASIFRIEVSQIGDVCDYIDRRQPMEVIYFSEILVKTSNIPSATSHILHLPHGSFHKIHPTPKLYLKFHTWIER